VKFNLRIQVFLVFACFAVLLTGGLFIYSRLSFERGFNHYMEQKEASRNARLIMALEQHFTYNGNWDAFKVNPHYWELFVWQYSANMRQRGERPIPFPFPPKLDTRIDGGDEDRNDRSAFLIRKNTQDGTIGAHRLNRMIFYAINPTSVLFFWIIKKKSSAEKNGATKPTFSAICISISMATKS
jgi:hypothetical protein